MEVQERPQSIDESPKRGAFSGRFSTRALVAIGFAFCALAAYSFLIAPSDHQEDFFKRFVTGARFELLLVGVVALIMSVRRG